VDRDENQVLTQTVGQHIQRAISMESLVLIPDGSSSGAIG
jgi:hypothetical protein